MDLKSELICALFFFVGLVGHGINSTEKLSGVYVRDRGTAFYLPTILIYGLIGVR